MASTVPKARENFGTAWEARFDETLEKIFGDDHARLEKAVAGYVRFALDATRLQKRFERELRYVAKTYEEAARTVYHSRDYMVDLYLPGILMSHFLWPHHYRQLTFFIERFVPLVGAAGHQRFCDVGIGTGFYSRQLLAALPDMTGTGFDISDHSIAFAVEQIKAFGYASRWQPVKQDVVAQPLAETWPVLVSVEVLEHLEDPVTFLHSLRRMLKPGGYGFITAAITAPNEDHIYLYNNAEEVAAQLRSCAFEIVAEQEDLAYQPRAGEPVPRLVAYIVR